MFLSKVSLDITNPSARQAIFNCNDMHRNLMRAFEIADGEGAPRMERDVLYRLLKDRRGYELLVMSKLLPDWRRVARYGYIWVENETKDISALQKRFIPGLSLRFALTASPTKKVDSGGNNSRRVFLRTEEERRDWLARQGAKYGFYLGQFRESALPSDVLGKKDGSQIRYRAAHFDGILTVTDGDLFWEGYTKGIGAGKAYGLGMLTVSRI